MKMDVKLKSLEDVLHFMFEYNEMHEETYCTLSINDYRKCDKFKKYERYDRNVSVHIAFYTTRNESALALIYSTTYYVRDGENFTTERAAEITAEAERLYREYVDEQKEREQIV